MKKAKKTSYGTLDKFLDIERLVRGAVLVFFIFGVIVACAGIVNAMVVTMWY